MKSILVPSYFYPQPGPLGAWNTLLASNPNIVRDVIVNPDSGPGRERYDEYSEVVKQGKKKGIGVMGYVATTYAEKPLAVAQEEIQRYWDLYWVTNIFLDEVTYTPSNLGYYKFLYERVQGKVVLNPGVIPDPGYYDAADLIVIFESAQAKHALTKFPAWLTKYRAKNCQIIHSCPGRNLAATLTKAGYTSGSVFVTDDDGENPYDRLPSYWLALLKLCA